MAVNPAGSGTGLDLGAKNDATRRIRIAHLQLLPLVTGVQKVTLELFLRLDRTVFDLFLICKSPGPLTVLAEEHGVTCICVDHLERAISPLHDLMALYRLAVLMREHRFDVLHTHSSKTGILGRIAGRATGVAVVLHTVHGFAFPAANSRLKRLFFLAIERIGACFCDAMIVLNHTDHELARHALNVPSEKLHMIPNGVDTGVYRPLGAPERARVRKEHFGIADDACVIGMVGRLWPQKNPECFVKAAITLLKKEKRAAFFLIGEGELRPRLENLIKTAGLQDSIKLLGWRNDVNRLLGGMDIFVLPSLWEGMPLSILEAMASGTAAVVSDIPGNHDLISDGITGLLFPSDDHSILADKLERLILDPSLRISLAAKGREMVLASYTLNQFAGKTIALYQLLLDKFNERQSRNGVRCKLGQSP